MQGETEFDNCYCVPYYPPPFPQPPKIWIVIMLFQEQTRLTFAISGRGGGGGGGVWDADQHHLCWVGEGGVAGKHAGY
jgi:hypothetical protein